MLRLSNTICKVPVVSLRTGGRIATAKKPIINPHNLRIEGWYCEDAFDRGTLILLAQDVRDFIPQGIAVNDFEVLSQPEELIRLQKILELDFELIGKSVVTNQKRKLGKVADYALDTEQMVIQKLYVNRPVYRSLTDGQLSIDHRQIVEINDRQIIVRDVDVKASRSISLTSPATS